MAFKAGQGAIWNNVIIHAAAKNKEIIALLRSLVQKIYLYFTINSLVRFAHSIRLFGEIFIYFFHLFPTAGNNFIIFFHSGNNTPFFCIFRPKTNCGTAIWVSNWVTPTPCERRTWTGSKLSFVTTNITQSASPEPKPKRTTTFVDPLFLTREIVPLTLVYCEVRPLEFNRNSCNSRIRC